MANIQKALDALQPYVIGIRYLNGTVLVDALFKDGWVVPDDKLIQKGQGDDSMNYYMFFSESPKIGLDDILAYVEKTIKLNLEKEKKYELLKAKVDELKLLFQKHPLSKLNTLKFTFSDEELDTNKDEFNLDIDFPSNIEEEEDSFEEEEQELIEEPQQQNGVYLDENHNAIPLSEEDKEMLAEEARAKRNMVAIKNKKSNQQRKPFVELPPRKPKEVMVQEHFVNNDCSCGPDEACNKCIDSTY